MSLCNRILLASGLLSLAALMGCGSSTAKVVAPPGGSFDKTAFSGTYVFSITGGDSNGNFLAMAGTVTADGNGSITGGTIDINDSGFSGPVVANPITGGTYTVTADGRGQASLTTTTPFGNSLKMDFVLSSISKGLITEFDNFATGSGSLDLQGNVTQAQLAGTYVFSLTGISGFDQINLVNVPAVDVGYLTIDGSGNVTAGGMDYNNNGSAVNIDLTTASQVLVGAPGTAALIGNSSSLAFSVYPISASHLKMIESDGGFPILVGDMFLQTSTAFPSGNLAFTTAGLDYSVSPGIPIVMGGLLTSDGSTLSNGIEDFDDAGVTGTITTGLGGSATFECCRYLVQLNGFVNGNGAVAGTTTFAAYPSSGGIQMVEVDGLGVTSGVAYLQTGTALAATQGYAFNLTASNGNGFEEDDIAEFTTTSSSFSGVIDINDQGTTSFKQTLNGTYTADSNPVTGRGTISANAFNGAYYTIDNSTALFLEADSDQLGVGSMQLQTVPSATSSNLTAMHLSMLRLKPASRKAWKKH